VARIIAGNDERMRERSIGIRVLFLPTVFSVALSIDEASAEPVRFNRDVLPILSDNCFACHGPDEEARQADLRLDVEEGFRGTEDVSGVVVPGNLGQSELWARQVFDGG
jgi:hypothetical protein